MPDLYFWETSINALGIRLMPSEYSSLSALNNSGDDSAGTNDDDDHFTKTPPLGWVRLLVGGLDQMMGFDNFIPDFCVGWGTANTSDHKYGQRYFNQKKNTLKGRYSSKNRGGWMATKRQLVEWHTQNCQHGLLPPFPNQQITTEKRAIEEEQNGLNASTVAALAARIYRLCWEEDFHPADYDGLGLHSVEYWSG